MTDAFTPIFTIPERGNSVARGEALPDMAGVLELIDDDQGQVFY